MRDELGSSQRIRVVIYTDQPLLADGALALLSASPMFEPRVADPDLSRLAPLVELEQPDLVLVDLTPEITVGLLGFLHSVAPSARLILWGRRFSEELRAQGAEVGVAGFIHQALPNDQFLSSLGTIAGGGEIFAAACPARSIRVDLTPRESQLVALLAQGLRNKEIGSCLGITEGTVRVYLSKLFIKVGARDRLELAVFGLKNAFCGQSSWDGRDAFVTENDEGRARPVLRSLVLVKPARCSAEPTPVKAAG